MQIGFTVQGTRISSNADSAAVDFEDFQLVLYLCSKYYIFLQLYRENSPKEEAE